MIKKISFFLLLFFTFNAYALAAQPIDHHLWDSLLKKHVQVIDKGSVTKVDYAGFLEDKALLQQYLNSLADIRQQDFDAESSDSQLATLINLYNAATVKLILSKYPKLDSIKDLGGFFQIQRL